MLVMSIRIGSWLEASRTSPVFLRCARWATLHLGPFRCWPELTTPRREMLPATNINMGAPEGLAVPQDSGGLHKALCRRPSLRRSEDRWTWDCRRKEQHAPAGPVVLLPAPATPLFDADDSRSLITQSNGREASASVSCHCPTSDGNFL